MKRKPTINDVGKLAGVSVATVSLVFSGKYKTRVSEETRKRVLDVAAQIGYRPNRLARTLSMGKTHSIALWTYGVYDAYYSNAVWQFQEILKNDHYEVQLVETDELIDENAMWRDSALWPVDGIIAFESPTCVRAYLQTNPTDLKPIVSTGAFYTDETDYVGVDLLSGTKSAMDHLIENGNRRIAIVIPDNDYWMNDFRQMAYSSAMKEAGLPTEHIRINVPLPSEFRKSAYENVGAYFEANGVPEAIFCVADELMIGTVRKLLEMGVRIPEDTSIVGCDGIPETEYHDPTLSTLETPIEALCEYTAEFLRNRLKDPSLEKQGIVLQQTLRIRESSDYKRR